MDDLSIKQYLLLKKRYHEDQREYFESTANAYAVGYLWAHGKTQVKLYEDSTTPETVTKEEREQEIKELEKIFEGI